jgi:hypothetical protein
MSRFLVDVSMVVEFDIEQMQQLGHELLRKLIEDSPEFTTELGAGATAQQVADWYAHNPETVASIIVRSMLSHGLGPVSHLLQIGQNSISSKQVD